jgi:transcriptional regulator with XRE-family HTH domain
MTIGERIKNLRKKNDLTQEKLADFLCVSYQAVSKWECGLTSPDLSLIAPLTKLLHVTSDELLGLTVAENDVRRTELEAAYKDTWSSGNLEERYQIANSAVSEYPGEMKYLDWLAWAEAMRSFTFEDDETYHAEQEKAIKHFACVIENAVDEKTKASSIQGIVQYLSFRGRYDEAKKYALLYPENYSVNKDAVLLSCLQGKEKTIHHQKMLASALGNILNLIGNNSMIACSAEEQVLNALIPDGNYMLYHASLTDNYLAKAEFYIKSGNFDDAVEALEISCTHAIKSDDLDSLNATYHFTSPFFDQIEYNTANIFRSDTTTMEEHFNSALSRKCFEPLRDRDDFKKLVSK